MIGVPSASDSNVKVIFLDKFDAFGYILLIFYIGYECLVGAMWSVFDSEAFARRSLSYCVFDEDLIPSLHSSLVVCFGGIIFGHDGTFDRGLQLFNVLFRQRGAVIASLVGSFQIHGCRAPS